MAGAVGGASRRDALDRILATLSDNQRRGRIWRVGEALLGATSRCQAFVEQQGLAAVLLDGTIHNEPDLRRRLGLPDHLAVTAVLAQAYARWGLDAFDRMVGDFACVIWDKHAHRLVMARDPMGLRPLFYWQGNQRIIFASTPRALQADPEVPRELDPTELAFDLVLAQGDRPQTIFRGIDRVGPGCLAIFENGQCRQQRWWYPERVATLRLYDEHEYADGLREVLDIAVSSRLPPAGPTAVTMSGGLDSTAVAALAARRLKDAGRKLMAFTAVPADSASPGRDDIAYNEGPRAGLMLGLHDNIEHVLVPVGASADLMAKIDARSRFSDFPVLAPGLAHHWDELMNCIANRGASSVLGGGLGNFTISYNGETALWPLVNSGRLGDWMRIFNGMRKGGHSVRHILHATLGPAIPHGLRSIIFQASGIRTPRVEDLAPLRPEFAKETGAFEHFRQNMYYRGGDSRAFRVRLLQRQDRGLPMDYLIRRFGVATTDPTSDRRVVEFCLSVPDEQYILRGETKSLIRRAMRGLVPDAILDSKIVGRQGGGWYSALTKARPEIYQELSILEKSALASHCLDLKRMRRLVDQWPTDWRSPEAYILYAGCLNRGLAMGRFIRRIEGTN